MGSTNDTTIPQFNSIDEERAYWEARGPLAEGRKGQVNRPRPSQKRSSFLAVRLTGEELTRLRDTAAQLGLGPSTFARLVLLSALENPEMGKPDRPSLLLMDDAQMKQAKELALPLLRALLAIAGVQLITPEDENYEKVRHATTASS